MTDAPAAFQATVHGFRTVPSRKVVQITIEAPIEQHATIAKIAEHGAWVGVARLQSSQPATPTETERERRSWAELTATVQAGIRCQEPVFQAYVREHRKFDEEEDSELNAARFVRRQCNVNTRSALATNEQAAKVWRSIDADYQGWKLAESM